MRTIRPCRPTPRPLRPPSPARLGLFAAGSLFVSAILPAPAAPLPPAPAPHAERSPLSEFFVAPVRVVWQSPAGVARPEHLLTPGAGQANLTPIAPPCTLAATAGEPASVLLDFGTELHGYVEVFTSATTDKAPPPVRIRFGESASEAMSELGEKGAQTDHALRDFHAQLAWLGVSRLNRYDAVLQCAMCGTSWSPKLRADGTLPQGYWQCPNKCNW